MRFAVPRLQSSNDETPPKSGASREDHHADTTQIRHDAGRRRSAGDVLSTALPQIEGNLVRAIAILTKYRSPVLPDLPSAHEQGLTDFEANSWFAFFVPKGTPAAIVQKLNDATVATMDTPVVKARLQEIGTDLVAPDRRSSEYLQKFVEREIERWAAPIKAAGLVGE